MRVVLVEVQFLVEIHFLFDAEILILSSFKISHIYQSGAGFRFYHISSVRFLPRIFGNLLVVDRVVCDLIRGSP